MKYIVLLLVLTACFDRVDSPESALREFVDVRLEKVVTKDSIVERTTGKLKSSLDAMTDEEFSKFADLRAFKRDSFKVLSKNCQEKRCYLTYSLGYHQAADGKKSWSSEVKKIAEVLNVEGKWLISDVTNLKTYHEASLPIDVNQ